MAFENIFGQLRATKILEKYILSGCLPSAFLFLGPDGVGRKTTAIEFAKILNCENPAGLNPCGVCRQCDLITREEHPFITVVDLKWQTALLGKESREISIDTVREIQRQISLKSTGVKKRFVILDSAQKMTTEAANSFLKTLEEPPPDTVIILISNSRKNMLPTIVSRCQLVFFSLLSKDFIARKLKEAKSGLSDEQADFFADIADGSLSRAIRLCGKWEEFTDLRCKFDDLDFSGFKNVDLTEFLEFLTAYYKRDFSADPSRLLGAWEAINLAKTRNNIGVNKNMILAELHSSLFQVR